MNGQTMTKTVSNTKVALATALLLAAGGLAFAAAAVPSGSGVKCGVNTSSLRNSCTGGYKEIRFTCYDGTSYTEKTTACTIAAQLRQLAKTKCENRCSGGGGAGGDVAVWTCQDDDKGNVYGQAGNTKEVQMQGGAVVATATGADECVVESTTQLKEFACSNNRMTSSMYDCASEGKMCDRGACVQCTVATAATACDDGNLQTADSCNATSRTCEYVITATGEQCRQPVVIPAYFAANG